MRRLRIVRFRSVNPLLATLAFAGCATVSRWTTHRWETDYENAERRARASGRGMLIVYRDGRKNVDAPLEKVLRSRELVLPPYERCELFRPVEADRRYADQFHVQRAPAIILRHPDDTYHAWTGTWAHDDVAAFLAQATPPGSPPRWNAFVSRTVHYRWYETFGGASEAAKQSQKPMLVVVHRAMTPDWPKLNQLLTRPEVFRRFQDVVHCRLVCLNPAARSFDAPFGRMGVPAIAVIHPDGTSAVLEIPTSSDAIVRFADRSLLQASTASSTSASTPIP